jgi:hypothetical protein
MIVFVPAYDEATRANLEIARGLPWIRGHTLLGEMATRESLLVALGTDDGPLFAMAHGKQDHLVAHAAERALLAEDAQVIGRRQVFAFACHTAARLGPELSGKGVTWWGYIKEVTAPDPRDPFREHFVRIFDYVGKTFPDAGTPEACRGVLLTLKDMCDAGALLVDEAAEVNDTLDVLETYQSFRDIWQLLRVCCAHSAGPECHPLAPQVLPRPTLTVS